MLVGREESADFFHDDNNGSKNMPLCQARKILSA